MKMLIRSAILLSLLGMGCGTLQKQRTALVPEATADCHVPNFPLSYTISSAPEPIAGKKLPKHFTTYIISKAELKEFFGQIKRGNNDQFAIPLPETCLIFAVANSNTMDSALAAKFPESMSLKGQSTDPEAQDARIDFDGERLRVQVGYRQKIYFLEPYTELNDQAVYLLWEKGETGYPKSKFE